MGNSSKYVNWLAPAIHNPVKSIMPEKYYLCRAERHVRAKAKACSLDFNNGCLIEGHPLLTNDNDRALRVLQSPTGDKTNSVYYLSMVFEKMYSKAV